MTRMRAAHHLGFLVSLLVLAIAPSDALAAADDKAEAPLPLANRLLLRGNYAEASELFTSVLDQEPVAASLGLARCHAATGGLEKAVETLQTALAKLDEQDARRAALEAELSGLAFDRGDYAEATRLVEAALDSNPDCLPGRWIAAELLRVSGKLDAALEAYRWLHDYYQDQENDFADPDDLRAAGLGVAQFARWDRRHQYFSTLVNDLYPFALAQQPDYWPAQYEAGLLFLEKFNQAEASRSLKSALEMNPNAAEVHAALARMALQNFDLDEAGLRIERAIELNPQLAEAHRLRADLRAGNFLLEEALADLVEAQRINPVSEETLGRVASLYLAIDGLPDDPAGTRFARLQDEVLARNPRCGTFYFTLAERLVELRRYPDAERFYLEAIRLTPQLVGPYAGLGMLYMRLGRETEAQQYLTQSFEIDPTHARVKNFLEVLDVLSGYAVIETDHFIIRFDRGQDELLARHAARYLEDQVYPVLTQQFAFEPEGKSLFEIFNRARNTNGHGWFSARMVGLPYVGTVGACAGKIVALASPNDMEQKYNWARVLKHEFVHVLNLQQTHFNIPHWYTEALATINEGYPRPQVWNELLAARVPARELFNLDTINLGFVRPQSGLDWQMAYCQAELYAQFMQTTYGEDALARLLAAYAKNLGTRDALREAFQVEQAQFEERYLAYLDEIVQGLSQQPQPPAMTLAELDRAYRSDPQNPDLAARLALAYFQRKSYPKALELARAALAIQPKHQLATYVLARRHMAFGEDAEALALLDACLDTTTPDPNVLDLLARSRLKAGEHDEAARLYEIGAKAFPQQDRWLNGLARVWLAAGDDARLAPVLAQLAEMDADDVTLRKKLADLALAEKDYAAAADWANQALQIDVLDPALHRAHGDALAGQGQFDLACVAYEDACVLTPDDLDLRLALAQACIQAGKPNEARAALEAILAKVPEHPKAKELLEGLSP